MCCDQVIKKNLQKVQNKAHFWLATAITFHPEIVLHFLSLLCTESWKRGMVYHHKLPRNTNTYQRMLQTLLFLSLQGSKPTTGTCGYSFVTLFPFIHPFSSVYPIQGHGWAEANPSYIRVRGRYRYGCTLDRLPIWPSANTETEATIPTHIHTYG